VVIIQSSVFLRRNFFKKRLFVLLLLPGFLILALLSSKLQAATEIAAEADRSKPQRPFYFPNTETLGEREMRVIALGTGTPHIRPSQASTGWLVELGNGDKFFFDVGPGSIRNFSSLQIPYDHANKVFLSHLHVDHIGGGWYSPMT
jgi:ribonuclease Z